MGKEQISNGFSEMIARREQAGLTGGSRHPLNENQGPGDATKRPRVLVIEDNPHDWEIYGKILWYNGFDVDYASDGTEGLRIARERRPDLVLLDLGLPDVEGLELCRELSFGAAEAPKVLVLSARPRREFEWRAAEAGCTRYLEKPIGPIHVLREVEELIGRPPPAGVGEPPQLRGGR